MKVRMLVVLLWLLTGTALSQTPGPVQISGQVISQNTEGGLGDVAWRVEGVAWRLDVDEALTSGTTDASGFFNINLPKLEDWQNQKHVAVRFFKKGFEQVSWTLNISTATSCVARL